jgi:hypothetical protein
MSTTLLFIILSSIAYGFAYRAANLLNLFFASNRQAKIMKDNSEIIYYNGCVIGCISTFDLIYIIVFPIYIFISMKWWIVLLVIFIGVCILGFILKLIEIALGRPNHQSFSNDIDLNALELALNERLGMRLLFVLMIYFVLSTILIAYLLTV